MKNFFCLSLFILSSACGAVTTQTSEGSSSSGTTGGNGSTTGNSVLGGSSTGGTGGSAGFVATAQEPIQPASYATHFTLNNTYTTCNVSTCSDPFTNVYRLDYEGAGSYTITTDSDSWSVDVSHTTTSSGTYPTLDWRTLPVNATSTAGCPGQITGHILMGLFPHQWAGAYQATWSAQACNGYASYSCVCAFDVQSTSYSYAHSFQVSSGLSANEAHELMR